MFGNIGDLLVRELFMQIFMAGFLLASGFSFIVYFFVREKIKYLEKIIKYHEDQKSKEIKNG